MDKETNSPEKFEIEDAEDGRAVGPIFLTFFVLAVIGGLIYLPFYVEQDPMLEILNSGQWWVSNVGEYHPLILHLPIGIVFLTLVMEVCSWFSFGKYRPRTAVGLFLAFLTGIIA
ncbi:hypothetical protein OAH35_00680, partial [bacterium]|nr:hypothetical protein [bacterium]